ncbi:MAG: 8-oxo-dGTP diphosphatase [Propionibacteriaceae bacterium]|jgi:8-oxo-dGTP diphosphatase|nr:8-oxo-dGTP diphosphatase [Propionibacteriaceae bacterium]
MSPYTPVLATLAYAVDRANNKVLLIFKDSKHGDTELTKYNGVGGKLEPGENVVAGMRREFTEETGLVATDYRLRGTVSWPGFGPDGESWFGFIFLVEGWTGDQLKYSVEGKLTWYDLDRLLSLDLPLWPGDRYFLPLVFDEQVEAFHGVLPYEHGEPVSWDVTVIPAQRTA